MIKMSSTVAGNVKKKVLLIGAGPTSSLISYNIRRNAELNKSIDIQVWEKARGIGGRFSTSRSPGNQECYVDLGAQYLTQSLENASSKQYFESLKQFNLIRPLDTENVPGFRSDSSKSHFACVNGTASIVKHFFEQASINRSGIHFNRRITKIFSPSPTNNTVEVETEGNEKDSFDLVVSTIPGSQLIQLENFAELVTDEQTKKNLEAIKYSSRFAVGLFFDAPLQLKASNHSLNFVDNDDIIRYWSIENFKRNGNNNDKDQPTPTSVVLHTSIGFGAKHVADDKEAIKPQLLQKATEIIPETKSILCYADKAVKCHKWRYSQVMEPYKGQPGCIKINKNLIAAGDGFSTSGFEGCIESAERTVNAIQEVLNL